ncbi:MAG: MutS-related protein [Terriglobales bacterium]
MATRSFTAFLAVAALFGLNAVIHYREVRRLEGRLAGLRDLGRLLAAARRLAGVPHAAVAGVVPQFSRIVAETRPLARKIALLPPAPAGPSGDLVSLILDYFNIFTLHQIHVFHASIQDLRRHQADLQELFWTVGEFDACQAAASFRDGVHAYAEPEIADDGPTLEIEDARHPLLEDPVPNSLALAVPGIAITGSNMSGKTTFLRTLALNVLLAQSLATCLASAYRGRTLRIACSMNTGDDLLAGKSYYLVEAERLLRVVQQCEGPDLVLALIDEPLAGTNSPERHAASREILHYLAAHRGRVVLSTHDVELVAQLQQEGDFKAYHFTDSADAQGIHFDYRLKPGLNYRANAIAVLRYLGYPQAILARASLEAPSA